MKFEKYQHIEKLGSVATEGILSGSVHLFSKLDGTNTSIYLNDAGEVEVASRNRVLTLNHDNAGALAYVLSQKKFADYLHNHPRHRLFGEWLVPHHIRNYRQDAWRKLYIFDVVEEDAYGNDSYLTYDEYKPLLDKFGIEYVPRICTLSDPSEEDVRSYLDSCQFLMQDGTIGEGIVIKNYDFVNQFGDVVWAKIVRPSAMVAIKMHKPLNGNEIEAAIVDKFITPEFVEKEFAKLANEGTFENKLIGKFLGIVWYTFITEEIFNVLRVFKNPKIDFAFLRRLTVERIKQIKPEIFK